MKQPKLIDYILLTILALIWASAFFNIKIATYSFGPVTIAFLRVFFGAIVKSLLFSAGESFILCLVSGDKRCSLKTLKKILDEKDVSMANPDDVKKITGYTIGGVSPVGHLSKVKIFVDTNLERFTTVFAAAGHPNCVFKIQFNQLVKLTSGEIKEIAE